MFDIKEASYTPENFFAGEYPVVTDHETIKSGASIRRHALVVKVEDGVEEVNAENITSLYGIAADVPSGEEVVCYLTGEFFANAIKLPEGVTVEAVKPVLRKLGIFLR